MTTIRTPKKREQFLNALADTCNVSEACKAAKIARNSAYLWRKEDPDFRTAWDAALEQGADVLEDEAKRRAVHGVDEPVFYQGEMCGTVRRYSDTLLIFLLKGAKPDKYRDRQEVKGQFDMTPTALTDQQRVQRITEILKRAKERVADGARK